MDITDDRKIHTLGVVYLSYSKNCRYDKGKLAKELRKILRRLHGTIHVVHVDNTADENLYKQISASEYEIGGDNSLFEFSGWQKGVDFLRDKVHCDAFFFVNDAFLHKSFFERRRVNQIALECTIGYQAIMGQRLIPVVTGHVMGNPFVPFVRTSMFMMSRSPLDALGTLISIDKKMVPRFFMPAWDASTKLFRPDAPISGEIQNFIFYHLTSSWYRKKQYNEQNFEALKCKAVSILNAILLSARVRQLGYPLISYRDAKVFSRRSASNAELNQAWLQGKKVAQRETTEADSELWGDALPMYSYVPPRREVDHM